MSDAGKNFEAYITGIARQTCQAELKPLILAVLKRIEERRTKPLSDPQVSLMLAVLGEILSEVSGVALPQPPMVPLQKRKKVTTRDSIWDREREAAERAGHEVWVHSEELETKS